MTGLDKIKKKITRGKIFPRNQCIKIINGKKHILLL